MLKLVKQPNMTLQTFRLASQRKCQLTNICLFDWAIAVVNTHACVSVESVQGLPWTWKLKIKGHALGASRGRYVTLVKLSWIGRALIIQSHEEQNFPSQSTCLIFLKATFLKCYFNRIQKLRDTHLVTKYILVLQLALRARLEIIRIRQSIPINHQHKLKKWVALCIHPLIKKGEDKKSKSMLSIPNCKTAHFWTNMDDLLNLS